MLISLRFGKPPDTITPQQLFTEVEKKLKSLSHPFSPKEVVGELLFSGYLTEKQWFQLERLYQEIYLEYKARRNLLLTRLDVTVKSFCWSERLKSKSDQVMNIYKKKKSGLTVDPAVKISHILAAKADLAIIEKTSSASVRKNTTSEVNKVIIGSVPDRGGRPEEQQPPPPEVPSWQKSDSGSARGGGRPPAQHQKTHDSNPPKNTGFSRNYNDENSKVRSYNETHYKNESFNTGQTYTGGRNTDYNVPAYQPVQYCGQLGTPQFGFGGYLPAGDNFQQYGLQDGLNQFVPRANRGGYRLPMTRGGYVDRGQSRGRTRRRGRN
ncbi:protein FAM98A-like [Stegodyphus dumicola]|uniref:protein FAM98A-like n=1 Tax=Stegodyphus dumicola TaxID=202533 RepID=UPI0015AAFC7B|nr:protein FAM98A-like [Stegodyphus dumicola]